MTIFWNGVGIVCSGLAAVLILKETRKEFVPYVLLTVCILVFLIILPVLQETSAWLHSLTAEQKYASVMLKAAGISVLTEVGHEICKACGETSAGGYIVMLGKAEIFLLTLPVFRDLLDMLMGYIG